MSELKIRFDHNYTKLQGQKSAILRYVEYTSYLQLSPEAILYDTEYETIKQSQSGMTITQENYATMHNGQLIRLEFFGDKGIPFTAYRKARQIKYNKYLKNIGQEYDIVIEESCQDIGEGWIENNKKSFYPKGSKLDEPKNNSPVIDLKCNSGECKITEEK